MKTWNCLYCNTEHKWRGHSYNHKYCNNFCQHEKQYQERLFKWKNENQFSKGTIKRYLSEQRSGCWECEIVNWCGKDLVLALDHIDGNASNNNEANLRLLCPNCHSQTKTYKGRNRGNGRHDMKNRYILKKSY